MKYSEVRGQIRSGDLIATSHEDWGSISDIESHAVRVFTESEYSHCCVAWVVDGIPMVIESVVPMVRIKPLDNFGEFYWIPTDKPMCDNELKFALGKVGTEGYSKWDAIAGQLELLEIGADNDWQCSELVIAMRRLSGLDLGPKATPSDVVKAALRKGYKLHFVSKD